MNEMKVSLSEQPLALHGTSAEAIHALLERGSLPTEGNNKGYEEWFYFTPVTRYFRKSEYAIELLGYHTKAQALSSSKCYAQFNSWEHYVRHCFGYFPRWFWNAVDTRANHCRWFEWEFKRQKGDEWVHMLVDEMWERKGFIIEPCEFLFERFLYKKGDDPTTIAFHCPKGLPLECVRSVVPLGMRETKLMQQLMLS